MIAEFDGFEKEYRVMDSGQRAAVLVVRRGHFLFVRQYRLLINALSFEIPGGRVDEGESAAEAAARECFEETGVVCRDLRPLISFQPGLDTVKNPTYVFCAAADDTDSAASEKHVWLPAARGLEMIAQGQILDSLSMIALLAYRVFGEEHR